MKKILQAVVFLILLAGVGIVLTQATLNRRSEGCIQLADFYHLEQGKVDALCIGSSHVYYGINTCLWYDEYGVASFLLASPGQPVWVSYYLLEEALKTQSPKLVVFDIGTLFRRQEDFGASSWETVISMKPSRTKWNAIQAVNAEGTFLDAASAFFAFPYYHTRSITLDKRDYWDTRQVRYHGFRPEFAAISESELAKWGQAQRLHSKKAVAVTARTEEYFRKFIELCQQEEIFLLLVNAPFANQSQEKQEAANYLRIIAKEYGVPLMEGNDYINEMQIQFEDDLLDASHLNVYGSVKYTRFLADWIKGNCSLPDRRGDSQYLEWKEASGQFWHAECKGRLLQEQDTLQGYQKLLETEADGVVAACWNKQGKAAVFEDGQRIFQKQAGQDYFQHFDLGQSDLTISYADGEASVYLDNQPYGLVDEGIHILVYDKVAGQVIDYVGFDSTD